MLPCRVILLLYVCCAEGLTIPARADDHAARADDHGVIYPPLSAAHDSRTLPLYVGLIQSYDVTLEDELLESVGTVVGTQIALDHINSDPSMFPGYSLHYNFINSPVCGSLLQQCYSNLA